MEVSDRVRPRLILVPNVRMDPSVLQSLLLKDVVAIRPGSRKRKAATQKVESAKRVKRSDNGMSLI